MKKKELRERYGIIDLEEALDFLFAYRDYVADNHPQIHEYAMESINDDDQEN